ncbi:sodium:proton antiporter [Aeoliella sp. SH292]|uniref:sodium:proton antiporter n=1 Tax=Aeoliella sp. SH292 TaxID=3454464 RepID=UPI003F9C94A8
MSATATSLVTMPHSTGNGTSGRVVASIVAVVGVYAVALALGLPQAGTESILDHAAHDLPAVVHETDANTEHVTEVHASVAPPFWAVIPFAILLGAVAIFPLIPRVEHWWESNANRFKVAASLAIVTLLYYVFLHTTAVEGHWPYHYVAQPATHGANWGFAAAIAGNAILSEFIPFIVLLFSLYTISGGIRISGDLRATPLTNSAFIAVGALLASFIGTTGAAMVLIRPLLETNRERAHVVHTIVFFIFVVCNCGGCLLPIGDPPLFLGYLQGVPFLWTMSALWAPWVLANGMLLIWYLVIDRFFYYRRESIVDLYRDTKHVTKLRFEGLGLNVPLLVGVVLAVALLDPTKAIPGTDIHPWMFSREVVQLALVGLSLALGSASVRQRNGFNYHAILEVAALFSGIFICMQPALQILDVYGGDLGTLIGAKDGIMTPMHYYWITGGLSSVLDNAPTYLVFFNAAEASPATFGEIVPGTNVSHKVLVAISLGAVFMGALTYIGNGPNFMVRAIAETSGVRMPSFFGYVGYSVVLLLPILALVGWLTL